jgi:hypothetical protein
MFMKDVVEVLRGDEKCADGRRIDVSETIRAVRAEEQKAGTGTVWDSLPR